MKRIFLVFLMLILSTTSIYGATESNVIYSMKSDYIDLTQILIDVQEDDEYVSFETSISRLRDGIEGTITGNAKTSVYFEDDEDIKSNTLRVDLDFAGNTLAQPVNTMFVTDQSGSMNMTAGQNSGSVSTTPCLHEDHVYKIRVKIDGKFYSYYHSPAESGWTGDWYDLTGRNIIKEEIKNHAIKEGIATETSTVATVSTYFYSHGNDNRPSNFHYDYIGDDILINAERVYAETPTTNEEIKKAELEKSLFTKIENDTFSRLAATSTWEFYSPVLINTDVSAGDYIAGLDASSSCYDRMNISKSVFHELSEIALTNPGNYIGFANFAGVLDASQPLSTSPLNNSFLNTIGRQSTYYEKGLDFAKTEFTKENETHSGNQNLLIFVTDGVPNGILNTDAEMIAYMDKFVEDTGAIVYFIGIDIPSSYYDRWGPLIATTDSYGSENMRNSQNAQDLLDIQTELEKILTSTTNLETTINENFDMTVDEEHPVTVNYMIKDSTEVITETVNSIDQLETLGITYDSETGAVNWNAGSSGITAARLTFYKQFDTESIDWEEIENGGSLQGTSLGESSTSYIDYSGREKEIVMDDTATYKIEKNSKLRVSNETPTPYDVEVGQTIDYEITVTNVGVLESDNNFVYQEIPEGTEFIKSPEGEYNKEANLIEFKIDDLQPGAIETFQYTVVADEYNYEIKSHAKLGVYDESVTLEEEGVPILSAVLLHHKTPIEDISSGTEDTITPSGEQLDKEAQIQVESSGVDTGSKPILGFIIIAAVSLIAIAVMLYKRRKK